MLAADPSLVLDLNSQPDPNLSSSQVSWPGDLVDPNAVNHFFANVGGVTQWWATDGTTAGTEKIRDLGSAANPSLFQAFGQAFVHASNNIDGTTVYWTNRYTPFQGVHLPFESHYLGTAYPNVIVQENSTNQVYAIDMFSGGYSNVASFSNQGIPLAQSLNHLYVDVDNPVRGGRERWDFRGPFNLSIASGFPITTTDQFFTDGNIIWNTSPNGAIELASDGFASSRTLAFLETPPNDIEQVNDTVFTSQYDPVSNLSTVRRLNSFDFGSRVIATLRGRAQLSEASFRLLVQVQSGSDEGYWWESTGQDGLDFDPTMSTFVGPVHAIGNTVLGWGQSPGVGSELLSYHPDPAMQLGTHVVSENLLPGFVLSNVFMAVGNNAGTTYELVSGIGDADNASFAIDSQGAITALDSFNYEAKPTLSFRIRATGSFGVVESPLKIYVADLNEEVTLSDNHVSEAASVGQVVGKLATLNLLPGNCVQYSIQSIDFDPALDGLFAITGDQLVLQGNLDFEQRSSYLLSIRATTSQGETIDSLLSIFVDNENENALSSITLTNDKVIENNTPGISIGTLGVRSGTGSFVYSLVAGAGDYDNGLFEIQGNELIFNDSANIEFRKNYSIRISASNGIGTVSDAMTIDVIGVDEYPPNSIDFVLPDGSMPGFFSIDENTPVGTRALKLIANDFDLDTYTWNISGNFAQYFRVEGNELIVNAPINFEAITDMFANDLNVTVTSNSSGNSFTRSQAGVFFQNSSFSVLSVRDVNDAPVVSAISNQSSREGESNQFFLASPLFFDEDANQPPPIVNLLLNGAPAPDWLRLDPNSSDLIVEADFGTAGVYTVTVEAVDQFGAVGARSFLLTIQAGTATRILSTSGNDSINVTPRNNRPSEWTVRVNGAIVYNGVASPTNPLLFDGLAGTDTITFQGTPNGNIFSVGGKRLSIDGSRFFLRGIETETIRGTGGNDLFQLEPSVYPPPISGRSPAPSNSFSILLDGGSGQDTILSAPIDTNWQVLRRNEGAVAGVGFTSIERLSGNSASDTFSISRRASVSGGIDGGTGGIDLIQYAADFGNVTTQLESLVNLSGVSDGVGEFSNIELITAAESSRNQLTYGLALSQSNLPMIWSIYGSTVQLSDQTVSQTFQTGGYGILEGTNRPDAFYVNQGHGQARIFGGGGENTISYGNISFQAEIDLSSSSGTGIASFDNIQRFIGSQSDSIIHGKNTPTSWTIEGNAAKLSTGESLLQFRSFIGGTADDQFAFLNLTSYPWNYVVDGGSGRNALDFSRNGDGVFVDLLNGYGTNLNFVGDIADVYGTEFNDVLIGNLNNNALFGMGGDDSLQGLAGNDALFGGSGSDYLDGGAESDWLVGGTGSDILFGGDGDDILVAGAAPGFEQENVRNVNAIRLSRIDAVMAEWTSNRSYAQRIQRLQNGVGANNAAKLDNSTLRDDRSVDELHGDGGDDWFFASFADTLSDRRNAERRTILS